MKTNPITPHLAPARRGAAAFALAALATALIAACGGNGSSEPPPPAVVAGADSATLGAGQSTSLLANDTIGGAAANASTGGNVSFAVVSTLPAGVTASPTGVLTVAAGAASGTVAVTYRICDANITTNCANGAASISIPASGIVSGKVVDSASAAGVAGVTVNVGALTATTDASGNFSIGNVPLSTRSTVTFSSTTHSEGARVVAVTNGTTDVQARLVRIAAGADVAVATGGTVTVAGSPAQVVLAANAVQRADGTAPTGNMRVSLTPINPAIDVNTMPGEMTTLSAGAAVPIESFGALNVMLKDAAGAALNLRAGQTATLRIPVGTRSAAPPATIPLFYLDNATGRWIQEGTATLAGTGTGQYYQGTVTHFSTWNADQVMDTVLYTGCVVNVNGTRIGLGNVFSDGINYSGTSSASVDANGAFTIPIRRSGRATLISSQNALISNTSSVGPFTANFTDTNCLVLGQSGGGVSVKLTWGLVPSDLDSHLMTPNGVEVYYGSRGSLVAAPFANLDVDDTSSYGPEVVTISKLMVGTYKYFIHNYSGQGAGNFSNSSARVELSAPGRATELYTPPTVGESATTDYWLLFEMDVDSTCNITVRRTGIFNTAPPSLPVGTATFCVRP